MAFDQPIESDMIGVDDFNLFSAFVRAPLWILGGVLGGNTSTLQEDDCASLHSSCDDKIDQPRQALHKESPIRMSIATDDVDSPSRNGQSSDSGSCGNETGSSCLSEQTDRLQRGTTSDCNSGLKRTKNLSWSDQSGRSLVEYNDEIQVRHEPSPYQSTTSSTSPKSVKSALKGSRSVRQEADRMDHPQGVPRYIPKMNRTEKGIMMPTRPFGKDTGSSGVDANSPQWGWYINTTPPTPEMYHSHSSLNKTPPRQQVGVATNTTGKSCHNQVFQNLQNSKAPVGWTSVPI